MEINPNTGHYAHSDAVENWTGYDALYPIEEVVFKTKMPLVPARILDAGCGNGRITRTLRSRGYQVVAFDLSLPLLKFGKAKNSQDKYLVMDASRLAFKPNTFDFILFSFNGLDGLYPLNSRIECLTAFHEVLKPGKHLYFTSHNFLGYFFRMFRKPFRRPLKTQLKFFLCQNWVYILKGYWFYNASAGKLLIYSRNPFVQNKQLRKSGFQLKHVFGSDKFDSTKYLEGSWATSSWSNLVKICLTTHHVHYISKKGDLT